jgi:formylmethanofuran dehydrogenase subunit E
MSEEFKCSECGKALKRGDTVFKDGKLYCKKHG